MSRFLNLRMSIALLLLVHIAACRVVPDYRPPEMLFEQTWIQADDPRVRVEPSSTVIDNS